MDQSKGKKLVKTCDKAPLLVLINVDVLEQYLYMLDAYSLVR